MPAPLAIFDLDGTLIDTAPDLIDTLNAILAQRAVPPIPHERARTLIGAGVKPLIERGLAAHGLTVPHAEIESIYKEYLTHYAAHIADRSRPFPGVTEALDVMAAEGWIFAVCTNKLEWLSVRLLEALGLAARFAAICGQDTFGVPKPDPRILQRTIERAGGTLERALMVGDSAADVATARAAGIPVVAVDFGYTETPAAELGADLLISHFAALPDAARSFAR